MKLIRTETAQTASEAGRNEKARLELRRRPVADLSEKQMEDAAGGHNTCEPTCPATCCPTCPPTCANTCPADCCPPTPTELGRTCPEAFCDTI